MNTLKDPLFLFIIFAAITILLFVTLREETKQNIRYHYICQSILNKSGFSKQKLDELYNNGCILHL